MCVSYVEKSVSCWSAVNFMLNHFQEPIFPRKIMTKRLGYQVEVISKQEMLNHFKLSDYIDCRINAYPSVTSFNRLNKTPISFIMVDLDLRNFSCSKEKLDRVLAKSLRKIFTYMNLFFYCDRAFNQLPTLGHTSL